jgi:chondroitin AC lyase
MHRLRTCLIVIVGVLLCVAAGAGAQDTDLVTVKGRLCDYFLDGGFDVEQIEGYLDSQGDDGSWPDFKYDDNALTGWEPRFQVTRCAEMARAYRHPDSPLKGDRRLKDAIEAALRFWFEKDLICRNWFYNQITIPNQMQQVLLLMEPDLSQELVQAGIENLKRAKIRATGQNLVWLAQITAGRACVQGDGDLCAEAFGSIAKEIRISTGEGIQPDMSFHQHGAQLYNGGYGYGFSNDCARLAVLVSGTRFAFPPETMDILSRYILDGQQWMFRGDTMDYSVQGRSITRTGLQSRGLIDACENMAKLEGPRRDEFLAFARTLKGEDPPGAALVGNKHFWRSDFMVHRRPGYSASVRMASKRVRRTEVVNTEGLKSDHLSDGLTYVYRDGHEYEGIFPVWDWRKLPGTTCEQGDRPFEPGKAGLGKTMFVGGVSDGTYGCAAFDFADANVTARKAWFYFDEEFVCLGAGITCVSGNPVLTTINQCLLRGDVVVSDGAGVRTLDRGDRSLAGVTWVHHDGVGYLLLEPGAAHVKNETQTGSWKSINGYQSPDEVSRDVFSIWIDHGAKPEAATYRYMVVPGISVAEMDGYAFGGKLRVLSNTPELQAVSGPGVGGVIGAAFYAPGRLDLGDGLSVSVDKPCLLLMREEEAGLEFAVSNPENQPLEVNVDVRLEAGVRFTGEGCEWDPAKGVTRIRFELPDGEMAGSTVIRKLRLADQ